MKLLKEKKTELLAGLLFACFLISLIPVVWVSVYNHPGFDDYGYAAAVHKAVSSGGGLWAALRAAAATAAGFYQMWQGTFAACFIFALQPGAFSDSLYWLTTVILLGSLIGATWFFASTVVRKWLGGTRAQTVFLACSILLVQIQFAPDVAEAFFWFNGGSYYTLFFSLFLAFSALAIRLILAEKKWDRLWLSLGGAAMAGLIGGGNYSTGLLFACTFGLILAFLWWGKQPGRGWLTGCYVVFLTAFFINMAAPGNSVRATSVLGMNPVKAVVMSFAYGGFYLGRWTNLALIAILLFLTPVLCNLAKRCKWKFRMPLLVLFVSFGLFACQMTPPLYAMSSVGAGRQVNHYFDVYVWMLIFDLFYLSGWVCRRYPDLLSQDSIKSLASKHTAGMLLLIAVLFAAGCAGHGAGEITSVAALQALSDGSARQYDMEISERLQLLENSTGDVEFTDISSQPYVFMPLGLDADPDFWVNLHYADFFGCHSVTMTEAD